MITIIKRYTQNEQRYWLSTFLVVSFAVLCLFSSERAMAICLANGYQAALSKDPSLKSAEVDIRIAKTKIGQATAGLLPSLDYEYAWQRSSTKSDWRTQFGQGNDQTPTSSLLQQLFSQLFGSPGGVSKTSTFSATLTVPIFNLPAWYDVNNTKLLVEGAEKTRDLAKYQLMLKVAEMCFSYLQAREVWNTYKQETLALQKQAYDARRGMEVGYKTIFDFLQQDAEYQRVQTQEFAARKKMEEFYRKYQEITGLKLPMEESQRLDLNLPMEVLLIPNLYNDHNMGESLTYQIAMLRVEAAKQNRKKAFAEWLPKAGVAVRHSRTYYANNPLDLGDRANRNTTYGFGVRGSLNAGTYFAEDEAIAQISKYEEDVRKAAQEWRLERYAAVNGMTASAQNLVGLKAAYDASRKAYYAAHKAQTSGFSTTSDVLRIEKTTSDVRQEVIRTYFEILSNRLRLLYLDNLLSVETLANTDNLIRSAVGQ